MSLSAIIRLVKKNNIQNHKDLFNRVKKIYQMQSKKKKNRLPNFSIKKCKKVNIFIKKTLILTQYKLIFEN